VARDKASGDFGKGWNVSLRNIRVETSGTLGKSWRQQLQPGFWPTYCLTQARPRFVTVTFPTGKVYRFKAVTSPDCEMFTQIQLAELSFEPEAGTHGTLTASAGAALIPTENTLLDNDGRVFDPSSFQLTGEDGTVYEVEKRKGLKWMQDRNGNTVSVSPSGVIHSAGKSITFERDGAGRITKMKDPSGSAISYEYDVDGNLTAVVDRMGNRTTYMLAAELTS
jgi:YD repeat-containing protein